MREGELASDCIKKRSAIAARQMSTIRRIRVPFIFITIISKGAKSCSEWLFEADWIRFISKDNWMVTYDLNLGTKYHGFLVNASP